MSEFPRLTRLDLADILWATVPIFMVSMTTGIIHEVSTKAAEMFGYHTRGELIGQPIDALVPLDRRALHAHHRAEYATRPRMRPMGQEGSEIQGLRRDGTVFSVAIQLCPVRIGDHDAVLVVVADMTKWIEGGSLGHHTG